MKSQAVSSTGYAACPFWCVTVVMILPLTVIQHFPMYLTLRVVFHAPLYNSRTREVTAQYVGILNRKSAENKTLTNFLLCFTTQRRICICNKTHRNRRGIQNSKKGFWKKIYSISE
jgi:hypothetical protein